MVRASTSQSVDLGFMPLVESYQKTLKMVFTAFLLGAQQLGKVAENKPASSLVVSLGKTLNGTPPPLCGDRWPSFPYKERVGGRKSIQPKNKCHVIKMQISAVATPNRK